MFTQFITLAIIVAIIGCIMYGRKLIRTEKVDAVFGNPERAKGGTHWIIVGSSVILLTCLLYTSPSPRDGLLSRMPSSA